MRQNTLMTSALALAAALLLPGAAFADKGGIANANGIANGNAAAHAHQNGKTDPQSAKGNDSAPVVEDEDPENQDETGGDGGEYDQEGAEP